MDSPEEVLVCADATTEGAFASGVVQWLSPNEAVSSSETGRARLDDRVKGIISLQERSCFWTELVYGSTVWLNGSHALVLCGLARPPQLSRKLC